MKYLSFSSFHRRGNEPSRSTSVVPLLRDDVQLSVEEYRNKLYAMMDEKHRKHKNMRVPYCHFLYLFNFVLFIDWNFFKKKPCSNVELSTSTLSKIWDLWIKKRKKKTKIPFSFEPILNVYLHTYICRSKARVRRLSEHIRKETYNSINNGNFVVGQGDAITGKNLRSSCGDLRNNKNNFQSSQQTNGNNKQISQIISTN